MPLTQPDYAQQSFTFKLWIGDDLWSSAVDPDQLIPDVNDHSWVPSANGAWTYWTVLRNRAGAGKTLGVHLYLRPWPSLAVAGVAPIEFAVRFSNGVVHPDGTGFPGRIKFTKLQIQFASLLGATMVEDRAHYGQTLAAGVMKIADTPVDGYHVFEPRWVLERRGVIVPSGGNETTIKTAIFGQGSLDVDPVAADFGPAGLSLIKFANFDTSLMATHATDLASSIAAGTKPELTFENGDLLTSGQDDQMGPWLTDDYPDGGAPAGYGIDIEPGREVDKNAVAFSLMHHELLMARNPVAAYDFSTGKPMSPKSWNNRFLSHTKPMYGEPTGAYGESELPAFCTGVGNDSITRYKVFNNPGDCEYEAVLSTYHRFNPEHLIRGWRRAAVLGEYIGDAMAKDDLIMIWRNARHFGWGDRHDEAPDFPGGYEPVTLISIKDAVLANPHVGNSQLNRAFGHMLMAAAWAGRFGDTEAVEWITKALTVYKTAADEHGIVQREFHAPYMPDDVAGTQHFHTTLTHLGAYLAAAALPRIDASLESQLPAVAPVLRKWLHEVMTNPALPFEARYDNNAVFGPPKWIGTYTTSGGEHELTVSQTWGDDPAGPGGNNGFQEHAASAAASTALAVYAVSPNDPDVVNGVDSAVGLGTPSGSAAAKRADVDDPAADMGDQSQWARWLASYDFAHP